MENEILIDGSNDKKFFTIIPNFILNHSSAIDQALYLQMKRIVGENGICYASRNYFLKQLNIGKKAYKKSIEYLLNHKWIIDKGLQKIPTRGGYQSLRVYKVNDIWKLNIDYYQKQGGSESASLSIEGGSESIQRGVQKSRQGGLFGGHKEEHIKEELNKIRQTLLKNKIIH